MCLICVTVASFQRTQSVRLCPVCILLGTLSRGVEEITFVGASLRNARKQRGWTQARLGQLVGVSRPTINMYENGRKQPGRDTLLALAKALEISVESLCEPLDPGLYRVIEPTDVWLQRVTGALPHGAAQNDPPDANVSGESASQGKERVELPAGGRQAETRRETPSSGMASRPGGLPVIQPNGSVDPWALIAHMIETDHYRAETERRAIELREQTEQQRIREVDAKEADVRLKLTQLLEDHLSHPDGRAEGAAPAHDA